LSCPSRVLRDIGETAAEVAKEIERQQPEGAVLLGGCSFGGVVAYVVAQHLAAGGHEIALLALLDPYIVPTPNHATLSRAVLSGLNRS
jgi:thioesterase domain-containing protein